MFVPLRERIFRRTLARLLADCESVLDVGCGSTSPLATIQRPGVVIGTDLSAHDLALARQRGYHAGLVRIGAAATADAFRERSFDAVVALDVIEHLARDEAERTLRGLERLARRKLIVFTPNGFVPQSGTASNPFQEHRCGFSAEDLRERGFTLYGMQGLRGLFGPYGEVRLRPGFFWRRIADASAPLVYRRPGMAFALLGVRELEGSPSGIQPRATFR